MEYNLIIKEDPYMGGFIVVFDGLPGCITKGQTLSSAIESAYAELTIWKKQALHSGFSCFSACCR